MQELVRQVFGRFLKALIAFEEEYVCESQRAADRRAAALLELLPNAPIHVEAGKARIDFGERGDATLVLEPTGWKVQDL